MNAANSARIAKTLASGVIVATTPQERLAAIQKPRTILMIGSRLEAAASRFYLRRLGASPQNALIITGHIETAYLQQVLAETLRENLKMPVIHSTYKIHQNSADIRQMLTKLHPERTVLVHAPQKATDQVCRQLQSEGWQNVYSFSCNDHLIF